MEGQMGGQMIDLQQMLERVRAQSRICVWTHNHPDPDAIASAYGLKYLFETMTSSSATIVYDGIIARRNNKVMISLLDIPLKRYSETKLESFDHHCIVDSRPGLGNNPFPADRTPFLVVDHHQGSSEIVADYLDLRVEVGSTASMVTQYLLSLGLPITKNLATALYYGIKTDTDDLSRDSTSLDQEMFYKLFPMTDPEKLARIEKPDLPRAYYDDIGDAILAARIYGSVLVSDAGQVWSPEMPAEMADFLLRMEGIDTTMVHGFYDGKIYFSLRCSRTGLNLGDVALRMVNDLGTAGGHNRAAGGMMPHSPENLASLRERFFAWFNIEEGSFSTISGV